MDTNDGKNAEKTQRKPVAEMYMRLAPTYLCVRSTERDTNKTASSQYLIAPPSRASPAHCTKDIHSIQRPPQTTPSEQNGQPYLRSHPYDCAFWCNHLRMRNQSHCTLFVTASNLREQEYIHPEAPASHREDRARTAVETMRFGLRNT
jgi:hypothetical protein